MDKRQIVAVFEALPIIYFEVYPVGMAIPRKISLLGESRNQGMVI